MIIVCSFPKASTHTSNLSCTETLMCVPPAQRLSSVAVADYLQPEPFDWLAGQSGGANSRPLYSTCNPP